MSGLVTGFLLALFAFSATAAPAQQVDAYLFWAMRRWSATRPTRQAGPRAEPMAMHRE